MKNRFLIRAMYAAGVALFFTACGSDNDGGGSSPAKEPNVNRNTDYSDAAATRTEVPHLQGGNSQFIAYRVSDTAFDKDGVNYCVEWDRTLKSNRWTCYVMTKQNIKKNVQRWYAAEGEMQYPFDMASLTTDDYYTKINGQDLIYGSGFDHGHLCPSNDRLYSLAINKQTFYLTNMQPQYKVFNGSDKNYKYKGLWINMEQFLYNFVSGTKFSSGDSLFVCKGGTIDSENHILQRIGGKMIVPKYFYAAVVWKRAKLNVYSGLAFWFEHTNVYHGDDALKGYVVSISELQNKLGNKIDFFCNLPDKTEAQVEKVAATMDFGL